VDDEPQIRNALQFSLERAGYDVKGATNAQDALSLLNYFLPDLVLLDLTLPDMDGIDLLYHWRQDPRTNLMPVIILSGRTEERYRVGGLRSGADDYITKPFSRNELLARIESIFRRSNSANLKEVIEFNGLKLDTRNIQVTANDEIIKTGPIEFRLLRLFMAQPNRVHTRSEIIDRVWRREDYVEPRAVDVQIRRLRRLLESTGFDECIQTVRGVGYRFSKYQEA
jgi:two-component system phosphate regulon response regulator PhoB